MAKILRVQNKPITTRYFTILNHGFLMQAKLPSYNGNDNATKRAYDCLKRKNTRAARAARISVHFFAVLHKATTWNPQILGFDDSADKVSIQQ